MTSNLYGVVMLRYYIVESYTEKAPFNNFWKSAFSLDYKKTKNLKIIQSMSYFAEFLSNYFDNRRCIKHIYFETF